jgi:hypothetical protein
MNIGHFDPFNYRLTSRTGTDRPTAVPAGRGRGVKRCPERVVSAERLEIRVALRQRTIFRVKRDGAFEMCDRLGRLAALGMSDREHIERVIVVWIFVADEPQIRERLIVTAAIDGKRRRVQALFLRSRRRFFRRRLSLADVQIEPHPFVQLLFLRVLPQHRFEQRSRAAKVVSLERLQAALVERDSLDIRWAPLDRL